LMPADPKPRKRLRDPDALRRYRLEMLGQPCEVCEERAGTDAHHVTFRSRGGDDTPDNLVWLLCRFCHDDVHLRGYSIDK
jgi:HNH endonuclease